MVKRAPRKSKYLGTEGVHREGNSSIPGFIVAPCSSMVITFKGYIVHVAQSITTSFQELNAMVFL
jgi:hypothetical protein